MDDAFSSEEIAPAAATTQEEAGAPQRADADVTDLLTAELDAAVAAAAPQRTDSTDVLTAELDALLAMPAPETAAPPAAKPPPPPQEPFFWPPAKDFQRRNASYFVAIVSVQSKQKHRNSRLIVRSSEVFREIQNSDDSVAIFGSP